MSISERLTKNAGLVLFAGVATKAFSFIFIAYAARVLGPHDFGIYAFIGAIAFLFPFFGNLGIGPMAIREMARDKSRIEELFNHTISIRIALVIVFYPLLIWIVNILGYSSEIKFLVYVTGLTTIVSTLSHSFSLIYIAREQFKFPSLVSVLVAFLSTVANIVVLYMGFGLKGLVIVAFLGAIIATVISGVWIWMKVMRFRFVFDAAVWKDLLVQSFPFAILSFLRQAGTQMNILLLSKLPGAGGEIAIGYYNPAVSLCRQAMILPNSFHIAALPTVSSNAGNLSVIEGIIMKSTKVLVVFVAFPLVLVTSFFPEELLTLVFGSQYLPSVPALSIFGWAFALQIYNAPLTVVLSASKEIKKFIPWRLLTFSVNIILAVPLIMYYSFVGAAIAFLITEIFETILRHHLLKVIWGLKVDTCRSLIKMVAPMALIFLILFVVNYVTAGNIQLMILMAFMYLIYLYYNNVLGMIAAYIPGFRDRK